MRQRGMSLVELLVGVAIGLFIVAATLVVVHTQLTDTRQMQLETQVQQDLRAATDIIARELRRAGTWGNAAQSVWADGVDAVKSNPYAAVGLNPDTRAEVRLAYHRPAPGDPDTDNDAVDNREQSGFRLSDGSLQMLLGAGNWQSLTDPLSLRITRFEVNPTQSSLPLACPAGCTQPTCPPQLQMRQVSIVLEAEARRDPRVRRAATIVVRMPNDAVSGTCP